MPYILTPIIRQNLPGMWFEGNPYEVKNIYSIEADKAPPVNYDCHIIKPHSLTHVETSKHVDKEGKGIDFYYKDPTKFFGEVLVIKLEGNNYKKVDPQNETYVWEISKKEIEEKLINFKGFELKKIFITTDFYPQNQFGFHDPDYVLILSQDAADYLISHPGFELYGTSWKSSDFKPGSLERPIHKTLFKKALVLECLDLKNVPEGRYFLTAFPLPLEGASESPVVPVLFEKHEINFFN
jgi:arylformamidase